MCFSRHLFSIYLIPQRTMSWDCYSYYLISLISIIWPKSFSNFRPIQCTWLTSEENLTERHFSIIVFHEEYPKLYYHHIQKMGKVLFSQMSVCPMKGRGTPSLSVSDWVTHPISQGWGTSLARSGQGVPWGTPGQVRVGGTWGTTRDRTARIG